MYEDQYDVNAQLQAPVQPMPQPEGFSPEETQQSADAVIEIMNPTKGGGEQGNPELEQWAKEKEFEYKERDQQLKELTQDRKDAREDKQAKLKLALDTRKAKFERNKSISDRTTARINQQGQVRTMQSADVKQAHDLQMKERDQSAKEQQQQQQLQMQAQQQQAQQKQAEQKQAQQLAQQKAQQSQQSQQLEQPKSKPLGSGKYN